MFVWIEDVSALPIQKKPSSAPQPTRVFCGFCSKEETKRSLCPHPMDAMEEKMESGKSVDGRNVFFPAQDEAFPTTRHGCALNLAPERHKIIGCRNDRDQRHKVDGD